MLETKLSNNVKANNAKEKEPEKVGQFVELVDEGEKRKALSLYNGMDFNEQQLVNNRYKSYYKVARLCGF